MKRLEGFFTNLAEWSCSQVQKDIIEHGDDKEWAASIDGFYLTRGHYSNNSSATLHDHFTGGLYTVPNEDQGTTGTVCLEGQKRTC